MSIMSNVVSAVNRLLGRDEITKQFGVTTCLSADMYTAIKEWDLLYTKSSTKTASVLASEMARLATIDMQITVNGGDRAEYIQSVLNSNRS